ncbi:MAG TPA: hypothetical protein VF188_10040 [Longimicrobiales bacterium]
MIESLAVLFLIGLVGVVALAVVLAVVGILFSIAWALAGFLLFKVAPIVLVGYIIVRFLAPRHKRLERAERKWLEG